MAYTDTEKVRIEVSDTEVGLYFLSDEEYAYLLEKNNNSIKRAALDAARIILFKLSLRDDSTVDVLSVKSSKAAENYRLALKMYIDSSALNPVYTSVSGYAGGISKTDYEANIANTDNKVVMSPTEQLSREQYNPSTTNPFLI